VTTRRQASEPSEPADPFSAREPLELRPL